MKYRHSPKVIAIAGAPAAGKTHLAARLAEEFGYRVIGLDAINRNVAEEFSIPPDDVRHETPEIRKAYKDEFIAALRGGRFRDIVLEGCRISHPHVYSAFTEAVLNVYGEYTLHRAFYLRPDDAVTERYFYKRLASAMKRVARAVAEGREPDPADSHAITKEYCTHHEPMLPEFTLVKTPRAVIQWCQAMKNARHPGLREGHAPLVKAVAEAGAENCFYQTVELKGETVLRGFTDSSRTWDNIRKLGVDFRGRTLCDFGCMLGYFSFKAEETGAVPTGFDIDPGAVRAARAVARFRGSQARFEVRDVSLDLGGRFDIILALNVLHRVRDFEGALNNLLQNSGEAVFEVGRNQLEDILRIAVQQGFRMSNIIDSHRSSGVIGARCMLWLRRRAAVEAA